MVSLKTAKLVLLIFRSLKSSAALRMENAILLPGFDESSSLGVSCKEKLSEITVNAFRP